jgi:LysM repeat protein
MSAVATTYPDHMRSLSARRTLVVAWPIALGGLLFAACGGDDASGPTRSTIDLSQESTAFIVRPTTPSDSAADEVPGEVTGSAQEYTVQAGDYPIKVAQQFGVSLDEMVAFNGWASYGEFPGPGETILIPPGGVVPGAAAEEAADEEVAAEAAEGEEAVPEEAVGDTIPEAGDNCGEGTHSVVSGDYPLKVAEQYDVTVDALDAANVTNPAYSQWIPGQTIVIPAKADC